jgi:putative transposase
MKRKIDFVSGYFYHIYNRGVEKRKIFLEPRDYLRFMDYLYFCNDTRSIEYRNCPSYGGRTSVERDKIVGILCYCLMPNHFHLLVSPLKDKGIAKFLQKLSTGYAMYFNEKNERTGSLFQGRYNATLIENESYFLHLTRYIHLNPLNLYIPKWKEEGVINWDTAKKFLDGYQWSSLYTYLNGKNKEDILDMELIKGYISIQLGEEYEKFLKGWIPTVDNKR